MFERLAGNEHIRFYRQDIVDDLEISFTSIPALITPYEAFKALYSKEELILKRNRKAPGATGKKLFKAARADVDKAFTTLLMDVNAVYFLCETGECDPATKATTYKIISSVNSSLIQLEQDLVQRRYRLNVKSKPPQAHISNPTMPDLRNILKTPEGGN
jgi:hypothetical protein